MTSTVSFGEQGGQLSYGSYLRVPVLLEQQQLQSDPPAHDELLFITIHQVYELWFKQILHELTTVRDLLLDSTARDALWTARHRLGRVTHIEQVLIAQLPVLETMTPQDFLAFRSLLAPASGFQSVQFRELEFLSGLKDPGVVRRLRFASEDERARLERRLAEPSLWDGFVAAMDAAGLPVGDEAEVGQALLTIARNRPSYGDLWDVAEGLLTHDELSAQWRALHATVVERQIGYKEGTGGSAGVGYLRDRRDLRYFPALWAMRTEL
ncbi:MAG: tryptophan 2,3-dioxygenase [Frankiaceae bacterium]|nr:tryptophan 2,3-dioxygenase [Frankiaceae bacterium]MBV9871164.1 tryptophan 2,3-dioxygenase [Frankiaceae bacterium]